MLMQQLQCSRFVSDPKKEQGEALKWLGQHLVGTRDEGLIIKPDHSKGLETCTDADFAVDWDLETAGEDIDTAKSRHGFIIRHAGIPLLWKSAKQSICAMSSTESEFICVSQALRTAVPVHRMLNEMKEHGFQISPEGPVVHCKTFQDDEGALAIAKFPKMRPRTKHINTQFFHFVARTIRVPSH